MAGDPQGVFAEILAEQIANLIAAPPERLDVEVVTAQRCVCKLLGMDRSAIWQGSSGAPETLRLTHLCTLDEIPPVPEGITTNEAFPWFTAQLLAGRTVAVPDVDALPPEASRDRESLTYYLDKSTLAIPLVRRDGEPGGAISFAATTRREPWSETTLVQCRLVAQAIHSVLARWRADDDRDRAHRLLAATESRLAVVLDNVTDGFFTLDREYRYVGINPAGARMLGHAPQEILGRLHQEVVGVVGTIGERAYRQVMSTGVPAMVESYDEAHDQWLELSVFPFAEGISVFLRDVSGRKRAERVASETTAKLHASLREKETLLREIHHRVKNNLQVISALLHFHSNAPHPPEAVDTLAGLRERIFAMSLLHEQLYQSTDVARIAFGDYVRALVAKQLSGLGRSEGVRVGVSADEVRLPMEVAVPCALIVSELLANVLKYAFPDAEGGTVNVSVRLDGDRIVLGVDDDGVGFPEGFDPSKSGGFGWELVRVLARQIDATVEVTSIDGAHVRMSFPAPESVGPPQI